jgi:peptidoglycan-N-acetylglucosamine deacetylase
MAKLVVTTSWDDGSVLDLKLGELLTKYGIKGTFYIPNFSRRVTSLQKDEITELSKSHEIGGHTITHPHLTMILQSEAKTEIEGSKLYLEAILGKHIRMFSYPFGEFNDDVKNIIKGCGYIGARTVKFNGFADTCDPYEFGVTMVAANPRRDAANEASLRAMGVAKEALTDWEVKAKALFDVALVKGGVWHLWGHSWEIDEHNSWERLDRVLNYISHRKGVLYATNGETIDAGCPGQ